MIWIFVDNALIFFSKLLCPWPLPQCWCFLLSFMKYISHSILPINIRVLIKKPIPLSKSNIRRKKPPNSDMSWSTSYTYLVCSLRLLSRKKYAPNKISWYSSFQVIPSSNVNFFSLTNLFELKAGVWISVTYWKFLYSLSKSHLPVDEEILLCCMKLFTSL